MTLVEAVPLGDAEPGGKPGKQSRGFFPPWSGRQDVPLQGQEPEEEHRGDQVLDPLRRIDVYEAETFHCTTSPSLRLFTVFPSDLKAGSAPRIGIRLMTHWNTQSSMLMTASVIQISIQDG